MRAALAVILGLLFLAAVLLEKTLQGLPAKELRRRARAKKTTRTTNIYRLAAFGRSAKLFLWLIGTLSAAGLILMAAAISWWAGLLVTLLVVGLTWVIRPLSSAAGWLFRLAAIAATVVSPVVAFLQPVLGRLSSWLQRSSFIQPATGVYEKEDLLEFLKIQSRQTDNRIPLDDLKTASGALSLSDKTVGSVMTPRRQIKWVAASENIGPMIMDELHQSGQSRFPVVKEVTKAADPEIVGALYLPDLLAHLEDKGRIRDIMHEGVYFINESHNLLSAIDGFLKSGQHLLVVVNDFEEIVGVLTLDNVLEQIFGQKIDDDFDRYDDIRAVASGETEQTDSQPHQAEVE